MNQIEIKSLTLGMVSTNCYLIVNKTTREVLIVDPAEDAYKIEKIIDNAGMTPVAVLLTHGHFDHIYSVDYVREKLA